MNYAHKNVWRTVIIAANYQQRLGFQKKKSTAIRDLYNKFLNAKVQFETQKT